MQAIWITWEKQRRNQSMAARFGATIHELEYRGNRLIRYLVLGAKTFKIARQRGIDVIFFQNPSIVLSALIAGLKFLKLTRAKTVGDFHNAGVHPPVLKFLLPWIVRHTDLVIVSNRNLEPAITSLGGTCVSIPDPIPHIAPAQTAVTTDTFEAFFICSWADDEPIANVLLASEMILRQAPQIRVSVTGRPKLQTVGWDKPVPQNVNLTGFLKEHDFDSRLAASNVVIDLTTRSDCMVCGAYEAVAAEVPMILSDNQPTRDYFSSGALFTDNSAQDIARSILDARERHDALRAQVIQLKRDLLKSEETAFLRLRNALA